MADLYGRPDEDSKVFTLPSAGSVLLHGPEMNLIRTREFQRLAGIKQLGTSYLVYRGATHTRFDHSLGTLNQIELMIRTIVRTGGGDIDPDAHKLARLFALLHDIAHVPFGHTLEDELRLIPRHDRNRPRLRRLVETGDVRRILRNSVGTDLYNELIRMMTAPDDKVPDLAFPYVWDLVGNTVCADLLDYVQRDLRACGMPVGIGTRFLDSFVITSDAFKEGDRNRMALDLEKRGMPRPDVESEVVKLLSYRYELAERVYFHHGKNAASVMIGRAVVRAGLVEAQDIPYQQDEAFDWLSDETLLYALTSPTIARGLGIRRRRRTSGELQEAGELARAVLERRLYKIAYLGVRDDLEDAAEGLYANYAEAGERMELEDRIARRAGLNPGDVLVHLPSPDMLLKPALVRVITPGRNVVNFAEWDEYHSGRTGAINRAHQRLWRVTAYVHPDVAKEDRALVRVAAQAEFSAASRYVPPAALSPYLREVFEREAPLREWNLEDRRAVEEDAALSEAVTYREVVREMAATIRNRHREAEGENGARRRTRRRRE